MRTKTLLYAPPLALALVIAPASGPAPAASGAPPAAVSAVSGPAPATGPTVTGTAPATGLAPAAAPAASGDCPPGALCLWTAEDFRGARRTYELAGTDVEACTALPSGAAAEALANRTGRPVTTYQSRECAEHGAFDTYPGSGVWAPRSPYLIRAFRIWER
ncbi:peptidase inhibitor family I36 protein [Streptomyces sp. NPDC003691]